MEKLLTDRRTFNNRAEGEVKYINKYAVFMGYLSMAIKGMGFLVLTWTTVVLLGGFVSMLHKKDFWCLTFITLVQTAGIFDVVLNEKLHCMKNSAIGMIKAVFFGMTKNTNSTRAFVGRSVLACILILVQVIVLAAALCPLAIIYMFGILMSSGISLWRLIEHDYSVEGLNGESSNLEPAMTTLYYLALLQGVIFCYRFVLCRSGERLAKQVATKSHVLELPVVHHYLHTMKTGCEKDPSFAKERNLVTHAINLIGSNSPIDCILGVKILYTSICIVERDSKDNVRGHHMLMKHLVVSGSSSTHILHNLLGMLDSRGTHNREMREQAAMIVDHLAFNISLEQFPHGIQQISSLIGTFEQYSIAEPFERDYLCEKYQQDLKLLVTHHLPLPTVELGEAYKKLLLKGLCILRKLATDEKNCRVMSNTQDLLSKIMAPITNDLLKHTTVDHGPWSDVVEESMELMVQFTSASGETGAKLRREISTCKEAIRTLQRILRCNGCSEVLHQQAIRILTRLYMDTTQANRPVCSVVLQKEDFLRMVDMFMSGKKCHRSIREYAGAALSEICFRGGVSDDDATVAILKSNDVIQRLTHILLYDENETCREESAKILKHLCTHRTNDEECLDKLKKAILEVLEAICTYKDETLVGKDSDQCGFNKVETDIESQYNDVRGKGVTSSSSSCPQKDENKVLVSMFGYKDKSNTGIESDQGGFGIRISSSSSSHPENNGRKASQQPVLSVTFLSSFISLCGTVYDMFICEPGPDLALQFHSFCFLNKLKEIVVKQSDVTVGNLSLFKAIAKMVILLLKHSGSKIVYQEDIKSLIKALSTASNNMLYLDYSMVFSSTSKSEFRSKLGGCTLMSLVTEAQELMMSSTPVSG
ncbi:unnamed protein product [Triticum turgidum subsp. durum]|uniref:Uncharacterized protein n=1 Tax=Triticum turgidum subsp. durum TaxID=4567 RepID=A0A9R1B5Q4_TRITD|nr:unnamed protein product [Triticum turgidum subsp. durum]